MKKARILLIIIVLLFCRANSTLALDLSGYLENKCIVVEGEDFTGINKFKLDLKTETEQYFMLVSANAINSYGLGSNTTYELNRAYVDFYPKWGSIAIGKQRIAWGNSYLFNLADLFNPINPLDPKAEKQGVDGLDVKWNMASTAQAELVMLPLARFSDSDYGLKLQWTMGRFDIVLNSLQKSNITPLLAKRQTNVIEFKGDLGDKAPGLWVQIANNIDTNKNDNASNNYNCVVVGSDYTIDLGEGIYLLGEYNYDNSNEDKQTYFRIRYNPKSYWTISLNGLIKIRNNASFYNLGLEYQLNDSVAIIGDFIGYPQGSNQLSMFVNEPNRDNELTFKVKTNF